MNPGSIVTCLIGDNADLFAEVSRLYLKTGDAVADVTFGQGVFWRKIDLKNIKLYPSDIQTMPDFAFDFRSLPYGSGVFDCVVFDPPYMHNPGKPAVNKNYQNAETTKGLYHKDIIDLYVQGMAEAHRILKPKGFLFVKCQDEIESGRQNWSHIEIFDVAKTLKFYAKDLFVLLQKRKPIQQHKAQKHARKNHSYLWVFQK